MEFVKETNEGSSPPACVPTSSTQKDADVEAKLSGEDSETVMNENERDVDNATGVSDNMSGRRKGVGRGVCRYYRQGRCTKGDFCVFSHDIPPDEIGTPNGK